MLTSKYEVYAICAIYGMASKHKHERYLDLTLKRRVDLNLACEAASA